MPYLAKVSRVSLLNTPAVLSCLPQLICVRQRQKIRGLEALSALSALARCGTIQPHGALVFIGLPIVL